MIELMITVLIAAIVLSIAYFNTRASILAYDMPDRIKANPTYSIDGPGYSAAPGNIPGAYPRDCESSDCQPADLAQYDINQWKFLVRINTS